MAIKPELKQAVAYNKIKAIDYNTNFNTLLDYIEDISEELTLKVNTINSQLASNVLSSLQSVYPVGSIYIGVTETCPIANLFGTWEKVSDGIITNIDDSLPVVGNGLCLGITNGSGTAGFYHYKSNTAYVNVDNERYGTPVGGSVSNDSGTLYGGLGVTTDPEKSGLVVDTSNITTLTVNIWKRTA